MDVMRAMACDACQYGYFKLSQIIISLAILSYMFNPHRNCFHIGQVSTIQFLKILIKVGSHST